MEVSTEDNSLVCSRNLRCEVGRPGEARVVGRGRSVKSQWAELQGEGSRRGQCGQLGPLEREETYRSAGLKGCSDCSVKNRAGEGKNIAKTLLELFMVDSLTC